MIRNIFILTGFLVAAFAAISFGAVHYVGSPDGMTQVVVEDGARLTFTLTNDGKTILYKRPIWLKAEKETFGQNVTVLSKELSHADLSAAMIEISKAGSTKYNILTLYFKGFTLRVCVSDETATCRFSVSSGTRMIVEDETFERSSPKESIVTRITVEGENVIIPSNGMHIWNMKLTDTNTPI